MCWVPLVANLSEVLMANSNYSAGELSAILNRGRREFEHYRNGPNLDRKGGARISDEFGEPARRKSRAQWEREIVGEENRLDRRKVWSPKPSRAGSAAKIEPQLSSPASRNIRIANASGATTINFRVDSVSRTSKRRSANEAWHSASHGKYIEREEAVAELGLVYDPADASDYLERADAVAQADGASPAIYTNISKDSVERQLFWEGVEQHETAGGVNELTINMAVSGSIAHRVSRDDECPERLAKMIREASPDSTVVFTDCDNIALRAIFERHGWVKRAKGARRAKKKEAAPENKTEVVVDQGIRFKDARAGITQIQANGELPAELSMEGKERVAIALKNWFDERDLRVTVVIHAPDHNNNEKNWHFHFAAYDRPCQRFINSKDWLETVPVGDTAKEKKDREKARAAIGRSELDSFEGNWDFTVPVEIKSSSRNRIITYPFERNKDRFVNSDKFIPFMRKFLVDLCNDELEREGHPRRYDHRTYEEMGIHKGADEHLDKAANQLEKMGVPTVKGCANEERQWSYLIGVIDQEHRGRLAEIEQVYQRNLGHAEKRPPDNVQRQWDEWRSLVTSGINNLRVQRELELLILRAKSRAAKTSDTCRRILAAVASGKASKADISSSDLYEKRMKIADDHLSGIDLRFEAQISEIGELQRQRAQLLQAAKAALQVEAQSRARVPEKTSEMPHHHAASEAARRGVGY
jgi:hypothetical protein